MMRIWTYWSSSIGCSPRLCRDGLHPHTLSIIQSPARNAGWGSVTSFNIGSVIGTLRSTSGWISRASWSGTAACCGSCWPRFAGGPPSLVTGMLQYGPSSGFWFPLSFLTSSSSHANFCSLSLFHWFPTCCPWGAPCSSRPWPTGNPAARPWGPAGCPCSGPFGFSYSSHPTLRHAPLSAAWAVLGSKTLHLLHELVPLEFGALVLGVVPFATYPIASALVEAHHLVNLTPLIGSR